MTLKNKAKRKRPVCIESEDGQVISFEVNKCWKNEKLYSLCYSCASTFSNMKDRKIVKAFKYQPYLNECNICGSPRGHDFVIFERSNIN